MTNQEAIEHIKTIQIYSYQDGYTDKAREALDMAISALQAQDSPKPTAESVQNVQNEDLFSRKAAIDAITDENIIRNMDSVMDSEMHRVKRSVHRIIASMPSAQPTLYGYDIEHLILIANVLRKENLPPERIIEALTDIGRIVSIVTDEFEESLRKAVEQCKI